MPRLHIGLLLGCILSPAASAVLAQSTQQEAQTAYYTTYIGGEVVGNAVRRVEPFREGQRDCVRVTETGILKLGRLGQVVEIESRSESVESADGVPIRVEAVSMISRRESRTTATFGDGVVTVEATVAGQSRTYEKDLPEGTTGPQELERRMLAKIGEEGAVITGSTWSMDANGVIDVTFRIGPLETVEVDGGKSMTLRRVEQESDGLPIKTTSWIDEDGIDHRTEVQASGLEITVLRTSEADALAAAATPGELAPDVFAATLVVEPGFLPAPRRASRAVLRVRHREGGTVDVLESPSQQRLGRTPEGELYEVRALTPPPGLTGRRPVVDPPAEIAESLVASSMIQCDHEGIAAMAEEIVGDERDAWRAAQRLEGWVEANVTEKGMDVGFASALEVFEDRAGDCSEHAVLLCALCRAAGIPSRVAMGFLYIGGVWGGHAWNEVWINGRWYALDGTLGLGVADALRLTLATMTFDDQSTASEVMGMMALGTIDIEVVELETARALQPGPVRGTAQEGRYTNALFGIHFAVPDGMELEALRPTAGISFEIAKGRREADNLRLSVRAYDVSPSGGWPSFLPEFVGDDIEVDGRPGVRIETSGSTQRALVRAGAQVFEFVLRGDGMAARRAIEAILASVDFDG